MPDMPEAGTLRLRGSITYDEVPELREFILSELSRSTGTKVVLELSGIETMDTTGAALLAEALKFGQNRDLRVLLCSPSESVLRIFRLAGFDDVLQHCCVDPQVTWQRLQD
jgi:anti-anti-sigma factor